MTTNETSALDAAVTAVLRAEAAAQKLSWPALAELSGVSKSTMSNYLNDASGLKLATLDAIGQALGLDILEVLSRARARMEVGTPTLTTPTATVPELDGSRTAGTRRSTPGPRGSSRL